MSCDVSHDRLWAWAHGEASESDATEIERHVASCADCREHVAEMRDILGQLDDIGLAGPKVETRAPMEIAGYEIVRKVGQGGMGVVFEALQLAPRRRVALKLILAGQYADDVQRRMFQREVQTLARLNHPGIASIYGAGQTDDGRQYFSMEFVEGATLTEFTARRATGTGRIRAILLLFQRVCDAISYAHQRGVIHRDLKPSNVLVIGDDEETTRHDEATAGNESAESSRQPSSALSGSRFKSAAGNVYADIKILDFGLAHLVERDESMPSLNTASGQLMGTLAYMSPEQAQGRPDAIDVRSDVYALGVMLYELLTGTLPYAVERAPLLEAVRLICEHTPSRPAVQAGDVPADVSAIVMKALEKEPQRRYQSVAALSEDIDRYLNDLPIFARPPSTVYHFRKMVARHKLPFALAAGLVLSVLVGGLFAYYKAIQVERAARQVQRINRPVIEIYESANPWQMGRRDITVLETLDQAADEIETQLGDDPVVAAAVRATLAGTYKAFGEYDQADAHYRYALDVRRERVGRRALETAETMAGLAENIVLRRGELGEAQALFTDALSIFRSALDAPDERIAGTLNNLGLVLKMQGQFDEAQRHYEEALGMRRTLLANVMADPQAKQKAIATAKNNVGQTLNNLGALYRARRAFDKADEYYRAAIKIRSEALYDVHPDIAKMANNYGRFLYDLGRFAEAESQYEKAVEILMTGLKEDHPFTATALHNLAWAEFRLNKLDESAGHAEAALTMRRALTETGALESENSELADSMELQGVLLMNSGRNDEALPVLRDAVAMQRAVRGDAHWQTARAQSALGECLLRIGHIDEAKELLTASLARIERERGPEAIETNDARRRAAMLP